MEEEINNNNHESKKERKERIKREREAERKQAERKRAIRSFVRYAIWIIIGIAIIYGLVLLARTSGPEGEDQSVRYNIQGRQHITEGASHPAYNSNPPSSGWHYGSTARGGFYAEPLPDEQVIHNLEHGDIWITYHPDISDEAKDTLQTFAGRYVVVSPREENEGDISLVAWGRVDTFDIENGTVDQARIADFIKRYDDRGPEKIRGGSAAPGGF